MSDSEVKVIISGESAGVSAAMKQAAASVREGVEQMKESLTTINESFESMRAAFVTLVTLFAGGIFKEIISSTNEWTEAAIQISNSLGISTEAATAWSVAIKEVGGTAGDVVGAVKGLDRQVETHEKSLNDIGIATREAHWHLLAPQTSIRNTI